jgi:hypothetical protein
MTPERTQEIAQALMVYFTADGNVDIGYIYRELRRIPERISELRQATGIPSGDLMNFWVDLPDRDIKSEEYHFTKRATCDSCGGSGLLLRGQGYCTCPKGMRLTQDAMLNGEQGL